MHNGALDMTSPAPRSAGARFTSGSLMRHVVVMASTSAIGLMAVFAVDLINLFYISLLGEKEIAAAVGFAGVVAFFHTSLAIGLTIAISAVVSRTIGAGRMPEARRIATASLLLMVGVTLLIGSGTALVLGPVLDALGATGETRRLALRYLAITVHSLPLLGIGMACSALLRSLGDARRAMSITLGAALVTVAMDPLLIFGLNLGLDGAAIAAVISRCMLALVGLHGVLRVHKLLAPFDRAHLRADAVRLAQVAGPAVLTNLATPVAAAFVTHSIAQFGPAATAGQATIDRLTPVAFGLIFALSGAVGPILAQNLGARQYGRVREALTASLVFMLVAVATAWAVLAVSQHALVRAFSAQGEAATLIHVFCSWLAGGFFFVGALFVANAAFNNLGRPLWSTAFNWGRATLGTIPFAWWGARYGPIGVLVGATLGSAVFGSLALLMAFRLTARLAPRDAQAATPESSALPASSHAAMAPVVTPADE
jgi:putative MATE family efflux protein